MARRRIRGARGRAATLETRTPKGILAGVLLEWYGTIVPPAGKPAPVWNASVGSGEYARPGVGCDLDSVDKKDGVVRCGEKACLWVRYRLREGGVTFLVRACSDHVGTAMDEEGWERSPAKYEDLAVHEVMTG